MKPGVITLLCIACLFLSSNLSGQTSEGAAGSLQMAQTQFEAGAYSAAIRNLRSIVARNPDRADVHYWLERAYYELHDYDSAIRHGNRSTQLDQQNALYHQWLGRAYGGKAGHERSLFVALKAQHEFEQAVRLNPLSIGARRDLQEFYMAAPWIINGSAKAREMVDAIAAIDPVAGHLARADLYLKDLKNQDLAENEYILVLDARPTRLEPYLEIAAFYKDQKNGPAMEATIQIAEQADSPDTRLSYYRGVADVIIGKDPEAAENSLKSYLAETHERSDWPSHASAHEWLGKLYEQEDRLSEAADQYRAALQIDPGLKEARERLECLEESCQ